jgi:hypothetical protein
MREHESHAYDFSGAQAGKRSGARHPIRNRGAKAWEQAKARAGKFLPTEWRRAVPRLLVHAIADASNSQYLLALRRFLLWCLNEGVLITSYGDLDQAGAWRADFLCHEEQRGVQSGKDLASAISHVMPDAKGHMPNLNRAVKAWEALEGNVEREPLSKDYLALVLEQLARIDSRFAWCAWLQVDSLLREQDVQSVLGVDVSVADASGSSEEPIDEDESGLEVSMHLGVLERGETTKTGTAQGVTVRNKNLKR